MRTEQTNSKKKDCQDMDEGRWIKEIKDLSHETQNRREKRKRGCVIVA